MTTVSRIAASLLAGFVLVAGSGCLAVAAAGAAGAGTYAYMQGEMATTLEAPLERAWFAAQRAVEQLEFAIERDEKDALQGRMTVRQADGTRIRIYLDQQTDVLTDVRVRVGVFGDEARSRLIIDKIHDNL